MVSSGTPRRHDRVTCPRCGSTSIEVADDDGNLHPHHPRGGLGTCHGWRGCPCDDGDGEGCYLHGLGRPTEAGIR